MAIAALLKKSTATEGASPVVVSAPIVPAEEAPIAPADEASVVVSLVERMEGDVRTAAEAFAAAKDNYAAALVDAAEGRLEAAQLAGYRSAYELARERVTDVDMALNVAKGREAARRIDEAREQSAVAWEHAVSIADKRIEAFKRLDEAANAFGEAWRGVAEANEALYAACPSMPDPDAAQMRIPAIADLIRIELARHGVTWAHDMSPSLLISRRPFSQIMNETPGVIRRWRDEMTTWRFDAKAEKLK